MQAVRGATVDSTLGGADRFTGRVWLNELIASRMFRVHFEPGARTNWHSHPDGQDLYILSGQGRVGDADGAVVLVSAGDAIHTTPRTLHWHGADRSSFMVHVAFNGAGETEWRGPVTDEQYAIGDEART